MMMMVFIIRFFRMNINTMKPFCNVRLLLMVIITIVLPICTVSPHPSMDVYSNSDANNNHKGYSDPSNDLEFRDMIHQFDHLFMQRRAATTLGSPPRTAVNSVLNQAQQSSPHQPSLNGHFHHNVDVHVHHQKQRFHRDNSRSVKLNNEQYGYNEPQQPDLLPMPKLSNMQIQVDDGEMVAPQPPLSPPPPPPAQSILPSASASASSVAQTSSSAASADDPIGGNNNNNNEQISMQMQHANAPSSRQPPPPPPPSSSPYQPQTDKNPGSNGMVVQPIVVANQLDSKSLIQDNVPEMLISIDNRLQKLQDSIHYYRTMNNYGLNSPNCPSYFSLIKTQFLSLENIFESKLSNIEHKFSNIEIEDGIWKKTINWKVEEMSSKITQTENKISFTNEQFMNKLDLIERSFKVITNDFFAKFLLINEKLNKIELNMQNNLNEFETKLWKQFDHQKKLANVFPVDPSGPSNHEDETLQPQPLDIDQQPSTIRANSNHPTQPQQPQWYGSRNSKWMSTIQAINPRMVNQSSNKIDSSLALSAGAVNGASFENISSSQILEDLGNERQDFSSQSLNSSSNNNNNKTSVSNNRNIDTNHNHNSTQQTSSPTTTATATATSTVTVTEQQQTPSTFRNINPVRNNENKNWIVSTSTATVAPMVTSTVSVYQKHEELFVQCEQVFKVWKQNRFHPLPPEDYHLIFNVCKELLSIDGNVWQNNGGGGADHNNNNNNNEKTIDNHHQPYQQPQPSQHHHPHAKERIEKRDSKLEEEIMIDNNKQQQPPAPASASAPASTPLAQSSPSSPRPVVKDGEKTANLDDIINQSANVDYIPSNKLDELDSKLQFFSTKIISIVQEMWHSTQTSQQYLMETFNVVNRTEDLIREELKKINHNLKPINQLVAMADDIREPILTRLKEMSTAINNSVEVILNTQAQYIMRQDDQDNKIMEIILNELHNKSSLVHKKVHEQGNMFNRKFDQLYSNINQIGKKTMEVYHSESLRLLDLFKSEIHTLKMMAEQNRQNMANQNNELDMDSPKSMPQNHHHHAPCENECFISRKEFENVCFNLETKPYDFRSETLPMNGGGPPDVDFLDTTKNISDIEINNGHNDDGHDIHHIHEDRSRRKFKRAVYEIFINNKFEPKSRQPVSGP